METLEIIKGIGLILSSSDSFLALQLMKDKPRKICSKLYYLYSLFTIGVMLL